MHGKTLTMFLCNNPVFASFLPEFLVALGIMSYIVSTGITYMNNCDKLPQNSINIETVAINQIQRQTDSAYDFANHEEQIKNCLQKKPATPPFFLKVRKEQRFVFRYFVLGTKNTFKVFLRPPPSLSLF